MIRGKVGAGGPFRRPEQFSRWYWDQNKSSKGSEKLSESGCVLKKETRDILVSLNLLIETRTGLNHKELQQYE